MASALERCVGDVERFASEAWGRHPEHYPGADPAGFADLLSLDDVDRLITSAALRLPTFRLIRDGATLPESSYTKTGRAGSKPMAGLADPVRILRLLDEGATIVLQGMHRFWLPLSRFCRDLELALGHPTQVNAYITPPGSRGLAVHEDAHDVFVLQAFGSKHWEIWDTRLGQDEHGTAQRAAEAAPPRISAELQPGDAVYMPRRTPHAARTQRTLSGHLTIGVPATTWRQVFDRVVARALDRASLDEPLPAGYLEHPERLTAQMETRLVEVQRSLEKAHPGEEAAGLAERFLTTRPPLLRGVLAGLSRLEGLGDDARVRTREGSACRLVVRGGRLVVLLGDRSLRMPVRLEGAMRRIAGSDPAHGFVVSDLAPHLDEEGRLVLVRRLVREGLLEVVGAD